MDIRQSWLQLWAGLHWPRLRDHVTRGFALWPRPLRLTVAICGAIMLAVLVFFAQPDWDWARGLTASFLAARMHRPVHIDGHVRVALLFTRPSVTLTGLRVGEPSGGMSDAPKQDLADIESLVAEPDILPLFAGQLHLRRLEIERPVVFMFQDAAGHSNWDFSNGRNPQGASKLPPVRTLIVRDGTASVTMLKRRLSVTGPVRADSATGFHFDGKGTQDGKPCTVTTTGPQLGNDRPYPFQVRLIAGQTQISANGLFLHPFDFGNFSADMHLQGASLSDLYYLLSVTAPNTPAFDLSLHIDRDQKLYKVSRLSGHVGGSDLAGEMTVDRRGKRSMVTADFSSRLLDLADLAGAFGGSKTNIPHKPRLAMMPAAAGTANRMMPDAQLDVDRLRVGDAKVHYRAVSVRSKAGLPVRALTFTATLNQGLLTFDPVTIAFAKGQATGEIRLNARGAVERETADIQIGGVRLEEFARGTGAPPLEGPLRAYIHVSGTGNSVRAAAASADGEIHVVIPGGTIRQSLAEALGINASKSLFLLLAKDPRETNIRCGVADFRIHDGVMQAQRIVLDTGVVLVNGTGAIDLRNEHLNIILRGKPKKFRLIRIDAPIVIGGHLTQPTFGISAAPAAAQGGLAAVVGSVLPFVTLDYAKDADCGALVGSSALAASVKR